MKTPDFKSVLNRFSQSKMVAQVAEELGGLEAQNALLVEAGYAGQPEGIATRLAVELEHGLPLVLKQAALQSFDSHFSGTETMADSRREAEELPNAFPSEEPVPSSQISLSPEELHQMWPWISGTQSLRLARAWLLTADPNMALACSRSFERFCRHNPPLMGWGWLGSGHLAVRSLNWLMALRFLGDLAVLKSELVLLVLLHLKIMGQVMAQEIEENDLGYGPDDVPTAGALLFLSRCLPFIPDSATWWALGENVLGPAISSISRHMPWDGPASTEAVRRAADFGGLCLWLARHQGIELPELEPGLKELVRFCKASAPPWGAGLAWDWETGGALMDLQQNGVDSFTQACNLVAVLMDDPDIRAGRHMDERLFWLFGKDIGEYLRRLAGGRDAGAVDLPAAGLSVLSADSKGSKVGLWLRTSPRHDSEDELDSADALSMGLTVNGQPLLVTPGPPGSGPLAEYLKSRAAFNSIIIDGCDPIGGQVTLEGLEANSQHAFCVASFDGYSHLEDPVILRRRVFLDCAAGIVNIVDQIRAMGEHICELFFHLPPGARVDKDPQGGILLRGEFGQAWLRPEQHCELGVATGRSNPPMGWLALEPGEVTAAPVVAVRLGVAGNARITTTIALEA
jgi:hypothetical protein